ncbi:RNA 2',3'-cyclic phosphodiesterase [Desulfobacterium sp. N47]
MSDTIRAFIALKLPDNILSFINKIQKNLKQYGFPVRWVKPENIHLTLKFFGNIDKSDLSDIKAALNECSGCYSALNLFAKGIDVFPSIMRPRIMWVGVLGDTSLLLSLQNTLDKRLEESGFKKDEKPFKGHLTMGRFKDKVNNEKLIEILRKYQNVDPEAFAAKEIVLFKSDLKPQGPVYTELFKMLLGNNNEDREK